LAAEFQVGLKTLYVCKAHLPLEEKLRREAAKVSGDIAPLKDLWPRAPDIDHLLKDPNRWRSSLEGDEVRARTCSREGTSQEPCWGSVRSRGADPNLRTCAGHRDSPEGTYRHEKDRVLVPLGYLPRRAPETTPELEELSRELKSELEKDPA
jgi:hypothetical protein